MKKVSILLIVAFLLGLFCGCDLQNRRPSSEFIPETQPTEPTAPPITEPTEPSTAATTAPHAFNIRDGYLDSGRYTDGNGKSYTYSYLLPIIDADSNYASACNSEIDKLFRSVIDEQLALMEAFRPLTVKSIDYETYLKGNVVTLYITQQGVDTEEDSFQVYTFNRLDGKEASHETMLTLAGFEDEEQFLERTAETIEAQFTSEYSEFVYELGYEDAYDRTMREENYSVEMPMYLDKDGQLVILATIYDLAREGHVEALTVLPEAEE